MLDRHALVILLLTTESKRLLLNGFGWVKYWRMVSSIRQICQSILPPEFCAIQYVQPKTLISVEAKNLLIKIFLTTYNSL